MSGPLSQRNASLTRMPYGVSPLPVGISAVPPGHHFCRGRLELGVAWGAGEGDDVADIGQSGGELDHALKSQPEPGMGY